LNNNNNLNFENKNGKWEFNENVAILFEDMLIRSIPQYTEMRNLIFKLGCSSLKKNNNKSILDLGCSNGLSLERFVKEFGKNARYTGIDISEPMIKKALERLNKYDYLNSIKILNLDLRTDFPKDNYQLITSILTLQFTPIEYRQKIIQNIYNSMFEGGMFLFVEKVLGDCDELNELMISEYYEFKKSNGYSQEEIYRKKLSLEGVLVPVTSNWNIDLLKQSGFKKIDIFWRWMNFVGYMAIK
jgi:tRNA (cmo5U34)-methyltransferase